MAIGAGSSSAQTAAFDYFHTTAPSALSCLASEPGSDEFDGTALDVCRWDTVVRQDPDFFAFYRTMQAYQDALPAGSGTVVLSPDSDFLQYFGHGPGGK